jgi:hypothetical protein
MPPVGALRVALDEGHVSRWQMATPPSSEPRSAHMTMQAPCRSTARDAPARAAHADLDVDGPVSVTMRTSLA